MVSRRLFIGGSIATIGIASFTQFKGAEDQPLKDISFPHIDDPNAPKWSGMATSLPQEHEYIAKIEGKLPTHLNGTLYRNGPGLFERGNLRKRNLLDGDGMVQSFSFDGQQVKYKNKFVQTPKFIKEQEKNKFIYATWTTQAPGGRLNNLFAPLSQSQAGVSVMRVKNRLYALEDSQTPFELDPETLETIKSSDLGIEGAVYSAHPKQDSKTKDWVHFGLEYGKSIKLHLSIFDKNGIAKSHRILDYPSDSYIHDFFVTENYIVLNIHPAEISYYPFLSGIKSFAGSLEWKANKGNQVYVIPKDESQKPFILQAESRWMWHSLNAYEKNGEIIADFPGSEDMGNFLGEDPLSYSIMRGKTGKAEAAPIVRYIINVKNKTLRQETILKGRFEFPIVNPKLSCQSNRYGYFTEGNIGDSTSFYSKLSRVDMLSGSKDTYDFGAHQYCGEPIFVPKPGFTYNTEDKNEEGWLLSQVYNGKTRKSKLAIFEANNISDGPVAVVHLNHHVPISFHGMWHGA